MSDISFIIDCLKRIDKAATLDEARGIALAASMYHERQTNPNCYSVKVVYYPADKKIPCIKVIRNVSGMGLSEAKDFSERLPQIIKKELDAKSAYDIKKEFAREGVNCEIYPEPSEMAKALYE